MPPPSKPPFGKISPWVSTMGEKEPEDGAVPGGAPRCPRFVQVALGRMGGSSPRRDGSLTSRGCCPHLFLLCLLSFFFRRSRSCLARRRTSDASVSAGAAKPGTGDEPTE